MIRNTKFTLPLVALTVLLTVSCGFKRKKYANPISKDTQQPDKVLFDRAVKDVEHGRYEVARLTLNTLINTYDTSEYLAKAKLAIADSWYREGGLHGNAQAEAEYKDFELFYPTMPEAAESQKKICDIHFNQMQKPDRDPNNGLRAEQECKAVMTMYPNSSFVPEAEQELRQVQEVLAEAEYDSGLFYHNKGSHSAAANRMNGLVEQYPLYSRADAALWVEADDYSRMGPRFRQKQGEALAKIVKDYPLSPFADQAKRKLQSLEMDVPAADPTAVARMKYEKENYKGQGMFGKMTGFLGGRPDVSHAAKAGTPTMSSPKASIPVSVPAPAAPVGVTDVTVAPVTDPTALDKLPDARLNPPAAAGATPAAATPAATTKETPAAGTPAAGAPATGTPAAGTPAATPATADAKDKSTTVDPKSKKKNDKKKKKTDDTKSTAGSSSQPDK
jgi:outer membrane protein assembly factor BamD